MSKLNVEKGKIKYQMLNSIDSDVSNVFKQLQNAMLILTYGFDPVNEISGLSDLNYDNNDNSIKGTFVCFKVEEVTYWEKGNEMKESIKSLEQTDFLITEKAVYASGQSYAIKEFCEMIQKVFNVECAPAEISQEKLEKTKGKVKNLSSVSFNNKKTDIIARASLTGQLNGFDLSSMVEEGHTIKAFKGFINSPIGLTGLNIGHKGNVTAFVDKTLTELDSEFFDWVYDLIMNDGNAVKEPSLFDFAEREAEK